jgi:hypothetical protein
VARRPGRRTPRRPRRTYPARSASLRPEVPPIRHSPSKMVAITTGIEEMCNDAVLTPRSRLSCNGAHLAGSGAGPASRGRQSWTLAVRIARCLRSCWATTDPTAASFQLNSTARIGHGHLCLASALSPKQQCQADCASGVGQSGRSRQWLARTCSSSRTGISGPSWADALSADSAHIVPERIPAEIDAGCGSSRGSLGAC